MSLPPVDPREPRAWLAPGFLVVGALTLLRVRGIELQAVELRGVDPELARWAAGRALGEVWVRAGVFGLCAAAIAIRGARGGLGRGFTAAGLAALGLFFAISWDGGTSFTGITSGGGLLVPAAVAIVGAALLSSTAILFQRAPRIARALGSPPALVVAATLGLALPLGLTWQETRGAASMKIRDVVCELALEDHRLRTVEAHEGQPPEVRVLSPLVHLEVDSADKVAYSMPPPCSVEFEVLPEEGDVRFHAAAGVDVSVANQVPADGRLRVRFEVLVDGETAFDEIVEVRNPKGAFRPDPEGRALAESFAWRHIGGDEGLALQSGQRVTLRTSLPDYPTGIGTELKLGFGGMTLERELERPREIATPDEPNLILVVMDTLRSDRCSAYGYPRQTTPNLAGLAARGTLYENAFSTSSWTFPSTASILTGLLPDEHGVVSNESSTLFLHYETLAEVLQRRGYTTSAITCNNLIADERLFDQGFESWNDDPRPRKTIDVWPAVRETLEQTADTRFFLYLHLMDPHTPHQPIDEVRERMGLGEMPADYPTVQLGERVVDGLDIYAGRLNKGEGRDDDGRSHPERVIPPEHIEWMNQAYDASVATGDHYLGRLLDLVEELGLAENTVIAFTSDHGEELLDHGALAHGHTLHRELLHVPLVIAGPGVPIARRIETPVSNRHLGPTLALIGGTRLDGARDAQNLLASEGQGENLFAATDKGTWNGHRKQKLRALREEGWVLHENLTAAAQSERGGQARLYDLRSDPNETDDLARLPVNERQVYEMSAGIERWLEEQRARRAGSALGMGAGARRALEDLGYIGDEDDEDDEDPERPR